MKGVYHERDLLQKIAEGDEHAFAILFNTYHKKVFFLAWRILQTEADAQDATQDIFTKLWTNREQLKDIVSFNPYLNAIIHNHIVNELRRKASREIRQTEWTRRHLPEETSAEHHEWDCQFEQAFRQLTPRQRRIFQLGYLDGWKHEEIAGFLQISKETVKKHMMLATRKVRNYLFSIAKHIGLL